MAESVVDAPQPRIEVNPRATVGCTDRGQHRRKAFCHYYVTDSDFVLIDFLGHREDVIWPRPGVETVEIKCQTCGRNPRMNAEKFHQYLLALESGPGDISWY